jgi:KDO2-lipid IV(A) lauroyltransferase
MLTWMLRLFARLPLPLIHAAGFVAGWGTYLGVGRYARRTRHNLAASGVASDPKQFRRILRHNIAESGKGMLESFAIWLRPQSQVLRWVRACHGWEHVEAALQQQRGIIFLTPHLGCFEITAQYYSAHHPISVLYRPPRQAWLAPLIEAGRQRGNTTLAPTSLKGVRNLLKTLKQGEAVGILPDQNPGRGEGEWADFFGRPAYTMTLVSRLAEATDAIVLLAFGERLSWGRGYVVHFEPLAAKPEPAAINAAIENLVRRKPEQYLWSYPRHRVPKGVLPPA